MKEIVIIIKLIIAVLLIWPRGYLLVYVIDRTKNFSFGFKLAAGLLFGISAFTLDVFSATAFGVLKMAPWIFYASALGQIFALEFVIFFFERIILLPDWKNLKTGFQRRLADFFAWPNLEKSLWLLTILNLLLCFIELFWRVSQVSRYYLPALAITYPANDSLLRFWLIIVSGSRALPNIVPALYYGIFLFLLYFLFPPKTLRLIKLSAVYFLSGLLLIFLLLIIYPDSLLFSIIIFLIFATLLNFLAGFGNSFFYISGIALAFAVWTKNEGLFIFFPLMIIFTAILFWKKRCNLKQMFIYWFFTVLTMFPWLSFILTKQPRLVFDLGSLKMLFLVGLLPAAILLPAFYFSRFSGKINLEAIAQISSLWQKSGKRRRR